MKFWCITMLAVFISAPLALAEDEAAQQVAEPAQKSPAETESADTAPADSAPAETEPADTAPADPEPAAQADEGAADEAAEKGDADSAASETESPDPADATETPGDEVDEPADDTAEGDDDTSPLQTDKQKTSYAIGVSIGRGLKRDGADLDAGLLGQGLSDALQDGEILLTDQQIREQIIAFQNQLRGQAVADQPDDEEISEIKAAAAAFLEENKKKEGVVALPSGLQYQILKEGEGDKPKETDTVRVHYRGTLIDGTEFDSSLDGDPIEFQLNRVVKGWTEGLQLMPVGSKWKLFIPSELGYGDTPQPGGKIRPGDALIFDVELLEIK
jgi:FKBP-type peptidyl-prolyl cis-trans isomerase FklB